jgi:hypothetical protein
MEIIATSSSGTPRVFAIVALISLVKESKLARLLEGLEVVTVGLVEPEVDLEDLCGGSTIDEADVGGFGRLLFRIYNFKIRILVIEGTDETLKDGVELLFSWGGHVFDFKGLHLLDPRFRSHSRFFHALFVQL